ncbi:MAG: hypothetical protein GC166_15190 [Alphaproteobacteria bacterium]|nr:hypothetical protein [Alphaproteobacteria bacterium]
MDQVALRKVFSKHVVLRALLVSLVVGSILNVINQGDAMMDGRPIDIVKLLLTYAVPYFVASYGAYSAFRRLEILNEPDR